MVACSNLRLLAAAAALAFLALAAAAATVCSAQQQQQLRRNYYASVCPNVESIVRDAVASKYRETFITVGATVHLFFHDCFVEGCDASVVVASTPNSTAAEKDHPVNLSLAGDGFDTVIRAKAAVDAVPRCRNRVSCADILAMATRDAIALAGGPSYAVELGRLDVAVTMDVVTPRVFDNQYFRNLQAGMGLLASDQLLYTDTRSRPIVDALARSSVAFERAFVEAITKMGRIGVKTGAQGNIRRNCAVLN
ncbi:LOW QUALITY PROTEIN: peroxidase 50 [Sorghum bicolor]|uniref:LOW QUALITY PROTEIN: peroxidase 50 n=1 Tax=Sorghum bicolor TaxID=4558 RepID=UPI000B4244DA|nr:LOW QUALITY PROTEIN: peroxidase 50 [Sorghum bicolor]|eukprot:XP_002459236.2 LOW QUALITY PROTEIN: peroxidase 50 [Sorghum bicolor]